MMCAKKIATVCQLKITLNGSKPPIWRRILVQPDITLGQLHEVLQIVMGWTDSHLHQFVSGPEIFGVPDDEEGGLFGFQVKDENKHRLSEFLRREKDFLSYEYDFGDGWEHKILLEKILPFDGSIKLPKCIKGKRACPPEDCGGIWGYQDLIEILDDASHPEHQAVIEWLGGNIDPEFFDLGEVNDALAEHFQ